MMFKGTPTHGRGQFARIVEQNGGQDNAFTSQDVTSYFVNIAADKLDLVIELEADRMHNLLLDPKEIDSERQVVIEERRTRTEDDPGGFLGEEVASIAFKAHPYGSPIIGWQEDIARITPEEIRAFYRTYYVPNNFWFWATAMPGQTPEMLEKELLAQVERLKTEPVTDEELRRAKNQIEAAFVFQEDSIHRRASLLARFEVIGGYAQKDQFLAKVRAVTAADLVRVAGSWFPEDKKNVGILLPKP